MHVILLQFTRFFFLYIKYDIAFESNFSNMFIDIAKDSGLVFPSATSDQQPLSQILSNYRILFTTLAYGQENAISISE
jgi:hypothetical protein